MRFFLSSLLITITTAGTAVAQNACGSGVTDMVVLEKYQAAKYDLDYSRGLKLEMTLRNTGDRAIRMIDGSIVFQDVLGRDILRVGIDPDLKVGAGETARQEGAYPNTRLLDVENDDVVVTSCVRGAVFSDGKIFKADE